MSDNTENTQKMNFDSSTAVVSTARALRLGMPKLGPKAIFLAGDTVLGCEFVKNEAHAKERLAAMQKKAGQAKLTLLFVEPKVPARTLRGSTGRPKSYAPKKDKTAKAEKKAA